jgi:hypothetical protein
MLRLSRDFGKGEILSLRCIVTEPPDPLTLLRANGYAIAPDDRLRAQ